MLWICALFRVVCCGPLSLTMTFDGENRWKSRSQIVLAVVVGDIWTTNGNCEKESTQISHIESNTGPAKSIWIRSHAVVTAGQLWYTFGEADGSCRCCMMFMSSSIVGHRTSCQANCFIRTMPQCLSCNSFRICAWRVTGFSTRVAAVCRQSQFLLIVRANFRF